MDLHNPKFRADPVQLIVAVAAAIIDEQPAGHSELEDGFLKCLLHVQCIILEEELAMHDQAAGIVDEHDQVGLPVFSPA